MSTMERILRLMAEKKASDVYFSARSPAMIRINGQSIPINNQPLMADGIRSLLSEILPANRIEELEETGELNMAVGVEDLGNFRFSVMRQRGSFAAVIRYISKEIPAFESLKVPEILASLVMEKRGLILMVGATGSGKSTTLASMLDYRNERQSGHILTIEDPIEYLFRHKKSVVNQREVGTDTASLQVGLRNALRQAPDVIMIGEIRDRETMAAALAYAQSGHLCISTLHANNAYQTLNRILSFFPVEVREAMLTDLSTGLKAIISQRLLRTVVGTRVPAVEVMLNSNLIAQLIDKGDFAGIQEAMEKSMAEGSQTFEQDIARLITDGTVDKKEGMAYADSPTNLMWRLQNDFSAGSKAVEEEEKPDDGPSFSEFTFDVQPD